VNSLSEHEIGVDAAALHAWGDAKRFALHEREIRGRALCSQKRLTAACKEPPAANKAPAHGKPVATRGRGWNKRRRIAPTLSLSGRRRKNSAKEAAPTARRNPEIGRRTPMEPVY